jgi:hypothetical protein
MITYGSGLNRPGYFCLRRYERHNKKQMWTIHHRAFLTSELNLNMRNNIFVESKKSQVHWSTASWFKPDSNRLLLHCGKWTLLRDADVGHPPPSLSCLELDLNIPNSFWGGSKKEVADRIWLGPDSNRLLLFAITEHIGMRSNCGPSTIGPFLPTIEPKYT